MGKVKFLVILALGIVWMVVSSTSAFAAYSAHENDQDVNNFLTVYPFAKSTKLDDCSLCHKGDASLPAVENRVTMVVVIIATRFTVPTRPMKISLRRSIHTERRTRMQEGTWPLSRP